MIPQGNEPPTEVILGGFSLNEGQISVSDMNIYDLPPKALSEHSRSRYDGTIINFAKLGHRSISIEGQVVTDTPEQAQDIRNTLSRIYNIRGVIGLSARFPDGLRTWNVHFANLTFSNEGQGLTFFGYSISLIAPNPWCTLPGNLDFPTQRTITNGYSSHNVTVSGSYFALPHTMTLKVNSMTANTSVPAFISIGSSVDNVFLRFVYPVGELPTPPFEISFNSVEGIATQDGVIVDPDGTFPVWSPGSNSIIYSDNASARSVVMSGEYTRRFL